MTSPRLLDAVTLRHFGITEHLNALEHVISTNAAPYWTGTVRSEILTGMGHPDCDNVLAASFLGAPYEIEMADLRQVMTIRVALSDGTGSTTKDLGEAESIFLAEKLGGTFVTDDHAAYEYAQIGRAHV